MMNWLCGLFRREVREVIIPPKIEVTIHVPTIHVVINGGSGGGEGRSLSQGEGGGRSFSVAPKVSDDERLAEIAPRISGVKVSEVKFGQER